MFTELDRTLAELAAAATRGLQPRLGPAGGLTHGQIDRRVDSVWIAFTRRVSHAGRASDVERGVDRGLSCGREPVGVSHRSGAALYELPGRRIDLIEITCRRWQRTKKPGLIVHESTRFGEIDIVEIDGIPVSRRSA
jgi:hypothetical protein